MCQMHDTDCELGSCGRRTHTTLPYSSYHGQGPMLWQQNYVSSYTKL